ncbi:MAG: UDP-N-acetylmuramoylalanine--D-glutamate ligase [Nitrospirae bacterium]|nr:MAG: UDP-N-acetylmuramoylalanine--D-glutamate ligase [Nitrospirota bacterium]
MARQVNGKRVLVVGLARSGVGAANLLVRLGAHVTANDAKSAESLAPSLNRLDSAVRVALGSHPPELFFSSDLIVLSPGVPHDTPLLESAAGRGIPVIGELELAYSLVAEAAGHGRRVPGFLAITGTNGKSTTTTLLYEMVRQANYRAELCGNIGTAVSETLLAGDFFAPDALLQRAVDFFVVEVSSFQLDTIVSFRPSGAAILNITPDHLDRYHGMDAYAASKSRIFENQSRGDVLVLNADDPYTPQMDARRKALSVSPDVYYFSTKKKVRGAYCLDGRVVFSFNGVEHDVDPAEFRIRGAHNRENAMAAALLALTAGCGMDAVTAALRTFGGLEHRLELVRELDSVQYINDSKGTNVGAVMKSLESFSVPVVLIAGGRDKDSDFRLLRDPVREKVKALVLIGEAAAKIGDAVGDLTQVYFESDLKAAVNRGHACADAGDVVLLSPACASFDMFLDYEDRGRQFKALVQGL